MKKIMPFLMTTLAALSFAAASPSQSMAADTVQPVQRAAMSEAEAGAGMFGLGKSNDAYAQYFIGQSYLNPLTTEACLFPTSPLSRAAATTGTSTIRRPDPLVHVGTGLLSGMGQAGSGASSRDVVNIPPEVKHWHGAAPDSWFAHIAIAVPAEGASNEWLEAVDDASIVS